MKYFKAFQINEPVSILTPPQPPQMNITVEDCERDTCAPVQAVLSAAFKKMSADLSTPPDANLALPVESFEPFGIPAVLLLGKAPKTSSFNYVCIPAEGFLTMRSRYGTVDDHELAVNQLDSNVSVLIGGATPLPSITLNADFTPASFLASTSMRQFAVLARITIPIDVYRVDLAVTAPQSAVVETMRIDFTDTECREITILAIQCGRFRSVVSYGTPGVASALSYQLPYEPAAVEQPGSGAIETLTASAFDSDGALMAATFAISTWNIPYGGQLASALMANKGLGVPGLRSFYSSTPATFAMENAQPSY